MHKSTLKEKELNYVFLSTVFAVEDSECGEICCTCIRLIKIGNVLRTAILLSSSVSRGHYRRREERCVALSIFLMQSSSLGTDRQVGLKGSGVNVPVWTLKKSSGCPRNACETFTVELKLKHVQHTYNDMYEDVCFQNM